MPSYPPSELIRLVAALRFEPSDRPPTPSRTRGTLNVLPDTAIEQLELFDGSIQESLTPTRLKHSRKLLQEWSKKGFRSLSVSNPAYPINLRRSEAPPALLFTQGQLRQEDRHCVAIVGSRKCSEAGRRRAAKLAREMAEHGFTIVSGLALGIDTAAHQGALAARNGRTIAVVGTGLQTVYPPENFALQQKIVHRGAVISPFWPDFRGVKGGANFLLRNRLMSDLTLATVVVEASCRSGARSQAAYARRSGNRVCLLRSLVETEDWAKEMSRHSRVWVVSHLEDMLQAVPRSPEATLSMP